MSGLRWIAIFEAIKGFVVLLAGFGILEFLHRNLGNIGHIFLRYAGLGSHHPYRMALLQLLAGVTDQKIMWLAAGIVAYSALRLAEAYGLWKERLWARWLGVATGGLYLPYEFYELHHKFGWIKMALTAGNIIVVIYLALSLRSRPSHE